MVMLIKYFVIISTRIDLPTLINCYTVKSTSSKYLKICYSPFCALVAHNKGIPQMQMLSKFCIRGSTVLNQKTQSIVVNAQIFGKKIFLQKVKVEKIILKVDKT